MGGCTPAGPGNPAAQDTGRPFDFAAHMAGLVIHGLDDGQNAGPLGWLAAFAAADNASPSLADLSARYAALPDGVWKTDADPRGLMAALPVFGVTRGGEILTEPNTLLGIDWNASDLYFALFDAMADHRPLIVGRAPVYVRLLAQWGRKTMPAPGIDKVIRLYAALYNEGLYMEAYKLLEMRWMVETQEPKKEFLHGLMQLAVGLHQIEGGKYAMQQLEEAYGRIRTHKAVFGYPTIERFIKRLEKATRLLKSYGTDDFKRFDLNMFPRIWFKSPWKQLFGRGD